MRSFLIAFLFVFSAGACLMMEPNSQFSLLTVCASTACSTPPLKANAAGTLHWPPNSAVSIYIDPSFTPQEQQAIKDAATAWKDAGAFAAVTFTTTDPGPFPVNNQIRISAGAPGVFAKGGPTEVTTPGVPPSSVIPGGQVIVDRAFVDPAGYLVYSPGVANGGYAFFTTAIEHELGHVLGLDDYHDGAGNKIDSTNSSVMGEYFGTNNQGFAPTVQPGGGILFQPAGNVSPITDCDKTAVLASQQPLPVPPAPDPPPPLGGGGGGGGPIYFTTDCSTSYWYEWDDESNTLTYQGETMECQTSIS